MENVAEEIAELKKKRRAILLAHVYQPEKIQEIADFRGDSFALSRKAAETEAEVIVFCGVRFMAETANILSPDKITLLPAADAGCRMFDDAIVSGVERLRQEKPDAAIVSYVNTPAAVKAMSDICCTSSNVVQVIDSLPAEREIIFVPDANLASYAAEKSGRKLTAWPGGCPIHAQLTPAAMEEIRSRYPDVPVLMHPECCASVRAYADFVGSTMGIIRYAQESEGREFVIATEGGVLYELQERCPEKLFHLASRKMLCVNMKKTSLEKVRSALQTMEPRVVVPEAVRDRARTALLKMLEITGR